MAQRFYGIIPCSTANYQSRTSFNEYLPLHIIRPACRLKKPAKKPKYTVKRRYSGNSSNIHVTLICVWSGWECPLTHHTIHCHVLRHVPMFPVDRLRSAILRSPRDRGIRWPRSAILRSRGSDECA